jgi:prepilin-type N-terminal cleavage/methylation domain-containing protein
MYQSNFTANVSYRNTGPADRSNLKMVIRMEHTGIIRNGNRKTKCRFNRKRGGFTMIEVVITIAVVAILAAILVPLISQNITSARLARAGSESSTIGKAIVQFRKDTGAWPIYVGAAVRALLFSDTDTDGVDGPDNSTVPALWAPHVSDSLSMVYHLTQYNIDGYNAGISNGPSATGGPAWNGPYLSAVKPDPWGFPYLVNAQWLNPAVGSGNVYVLSPGPNKAIETPFNGAPPANSDDITFRLQ